MLHDAALGFDTVGLGFVDEVDGHMHLDGLVLVHAQEIRVHDAVAGGVTLQILQNRFLLLLAHIDGQDVGVERLVFQRLFQVLAHQGQWLGVLAAAVNDGGDVVGETTQAAARTFPQVLSYLCL